MKNISVNKTPKKKLSKSAFTGLTVFMLAVLILYTLSLFGLLFYGFITSFKCGIVGTLEYRLEYMPGNPYGLPKTWYWNFTFVFQNFIVQGTDPMGVGAPIKVGMVEMFGNSILYALGCSFAKVVVTCLVAYLCSKYENWCSKIVYVIVVVTMIIPVVGSQAAEIQLAKELLLYDHIWGMWIMRANFLGMYFLVFYAVFKSMPKGYYEAATIDGANDMQVMLKIALPLVKYTFLSIFLILFIEYWNDYLIPNLYLPSYKTLSLALYQQSQAQELKINKIAQVTYVMTTVLLVTIPVVTVFAIFSKRLMGNLSVGGLKG